MTAWLTAALGLDGGLADKVKVGDRVRHRGTRAWGIVLQVLPQMDKTAELEVRYEKPNEWSERQTTWWATYHISEWEPA